MNKILTPIKAIRKFCLQCVGNVKKEVLLCTAPNCPLYPYRLGKRPKKHEINEKSGSKLMVLGKSDETSTNNNHLKKEEEKK